MGKRVYCEDGTYRVDGKRSKGDGSWTERSGGGWSHEMMRDGHRLRAVGRTKTDARNDMNEQIRRLAEGQPAKDAKVTLAAWMAEWKTVQLEAKPRKATTKSAYRTLSRLHIEPDPIGKLALDKLKPSDIDRLIVRLRGKGLAESTVRQIYHILRLALSGAVRDGLLARNPAELVDRPVPPHREARHLSPAELRSLLEAARPSRNHAVIELIAATGMRRGEALALHWKDIDFLGATLRIRGTLARVDGELIVTDTKTEKSRRTIELAPEVIDLLARHKDVQAREAKAAANMWEKTGFVFATAFGRPVDPRNIYRTLQVAAKKAKIEGAGVHTLRHSWASAMMESGENIKVVSEILGHSSVAITGDIYVHTTSDSKRAAMASMAKLIGL